MNSTANPGTPICTPVTWGWSSWSGADGCPCTTATRGRPRDSSNWRRAMGIASSADVAGSNDGFARCISASRSRLATICRSRDMSRVTPSIAIITAPL